MGPRGPAERILARFEANLGGRWNADGPALLAFSGGLASLILAAAARKRGDIRCVSVGLPGSSDVEAALVARDFLDYQVEVLRPTPAEVLGVARALATANPRLPPPDVLSLVPMALVQSRHPGVPVVTGFGLSPLSPPLRRHLAAAAPPPPGLRRQTDPSPPRRTVLQVAEALGIPAPFARAARRTPAEGSGVGPAVRALGHARHQSVLRLLGPEGSSSDNERRRGAGSLPNHRLLTGGYK